MKTKIKHFFVCKRKGSQVVSLAESHIHKRDLTTGHMVVIKEVYKTCTDEHARYWGCTNCGKVWKK